MKNLRELRKSKKITLQKLADAINVKSATISYYETGKRKPTLEHLKALSAYFNVSIDYLCGKDIDTSNLSSYERLSNILKEHSLIYDFVSTDPRGNIKILEAFVYEHKMKKSCKKN